MLVERKLDSGKIVDFVIAGSSPVSHPNSEPKA